MKNYLLSSLLLFTCFFVQAQSSKELQLGLRVLPRSSTLEEKNIFYGASIAYYQPSFGKSYIGIKTNATTNTLWKKENSYSNYTSVNVDLVMRWSLSKKEKKTKWFFEAGISGMKIWKGQRSNWNFCGLALEFDRFPTDHYNDTLLDHLYGLATGVSCEFPLGKHFRLGLDLSTNVYYSTRDESHQLYVSPGLKSVYSF